MTSKTIKEICEEYGLKQIELSRRFNIPIRTVQDWCRGIRIPPDYVVSMIDELLQYDKSSQSK
ncbi:MAG: helix-turn-helix domain-containing protein [Clostridia bacterium]|nr:helix-turn-helix domain-containing protein [Clostridia bacterium]